MIWDIRHLNFPTGVLHVKLNFPKYCLEGTENLVVGNNEKIKSLLKKTPCFYRYKTEFKLHRMPI